MFSALAAKFSIVKIAVLVQVYCSPNPVEADRVPCTTNIRGQYSSMEKCEAKKNEISRDWYESTTGGVTYKFGYKQAVECVQYDTTPTLIEKYKLIKQAVK